MIITWSEKGKVQLKAKTCLHYVNPLISEIRLTGGLKNHKFYFEKRTQFQDISHLNSNSLHKVNSRLYFNEILHNHWYW